MSDDYCFCRAAQGQLPQREKYCDCSEAVVKSHNRRKGAKLAKFAKSSKFAVKLQHVMGL